MGKVHSMFLAVCIILTGCFFEHDDSDTSEYDGLKALVRRNLSQIVTVGIARYEEAYGREFNVKGKYFLDSLTPFLNLDTVDVYVYQDSVASDGRYLPRHWGAQGSRKGGSRGSLLYFGIGNDEYVCFLRISPGNYRLYTVGKNGIDEKGLGDDFVYDPDKK